MTALAMKMNGHIMAMQAKVVELHRQQNKRKGKEVVEKKEKENDKNAEEED